MMVVDLVATLHSLHYWIVLNDESVGRYMGEGVRVSEM